MIREDRNHDSCALHRHKNHDICVLNPQMILLSCKNNRAQNAYLASELSFQSANEVQIFVPGPSELFFLLPNGKFPGNFTFGARSVGPPPNGKFPGNFLFGEG